MLMGPFANIIAFLFRCVFAAAFVLLAFFCAHFDAQAATIVIQSDKLYFEDEPGCTVKLTGEIVDGDLATLKAAFARGGNGSDTLAGYLCLNSPGGSYQEGLRIADWMLSQAISTVVQAKDICFSACAIIFMTGGSFEDGR